MRSACAGRVKAPTSQKGCSGTPPRADPDKRFDPGPESGVPPADTGGCRQNAVFCQRAVDAR